MQFPFLALELFGSGSDGGLQARWAADTWVRISKVAMWLLSADPVPGCFL